MKKYAVLTALVVLCTAHAALAISPTGFMPGVESAVASAYNSATQVWVPAISYAALLGLVINLFFGFVRLATKVVGILFGVFLLGGSLPWLASATGGAIATSFVLPLLH